MKKLKVLSDFSEFTGLRYCNISEYSGEEFYHTVLNLAFKNAIESNESLVVDLDNTSGYASSFLDEAFGNLVFDFTLDRVRKTVIIISNQEPHWKEMIEKQTYIQWEERRKSKANPIVTRLHKPWFRSINEKIESKVWELPAVQ